MGRQQNLRILQHGAFWVSCVIQLPGLDLSRGVCLFLLLLWNKGRRGSNGLQSTPRQRHRHALPRLGAQATATPLTNTLASTCKRQFAFKASYPTKICKGTP